MKFRSFDEHKMELDALASRFKDSNLDTKDAKKTKGLSQRTAEQKLEVGLFCFIFPLFSTFSGFFGLIETGERQKR